MLAHNRNKQSDNVLSHWCLIMDGQRFSPMEFYKSIEDELEARKVPRLRRRLVEYREGSLVSDKRVYLRLSRERFAFEICAAPFGADFFFSLRFVELPRGGWIMLLACLALFALLSFTVGTLAWYATFFAEAWFWWAAVGLCFATLGVSAFRFAKSDHTDKRVREGSSDFDAFMLGLPVVGAWYERVRKITYYRHDTQFVFHALVSEIVKRKIAELTSLAGINLRRAYEYSPILDDLYKRSPVDPATVPVSTR